MPRQRSQLSAWRQKESEPLSSLLLQVSLALHCTNLLVLQEAQKDVKQASMDIPASTPSDTTKGKRGCKEREGEPSSTKRPRSLFQTPTPRTKVKKESEEDESEQSDRESLDGLETEDNDLFGEGRFGTKGPNLSVEDPGKTKEEPKEAAKEEPKQELDEPDEKPKEEDSSPGAKDEHWQSLDDEMKVMLQKVEGELLDALPVTSCAKLC